mmetsp:Transcript_108709/g.294779  ORF Transcript_108709/g.294779 Transcript_108709/m.294779 type:complete len:275 (-) Transcript_108709:996-1820(-)
MVELSPTTPYLMRDWSPMLPTRQVPVWTPHRICNCGKSWLADQALMALRQWSILSVALTAEDAWSSFLTGAPNRAKIASPMNSSTMPSFASMTLDISLKYWLNSTMASTGSMASTMVVKEAMSEKNSVTSSSSTKMSAFTPFWSSLCTTCQGTYLPQDFMAFFMPSKVVWMRRISAAHCSYEKEVVTPASCRWVMLCISSARFRSGWRRLLRKLIMSLAMEVKPNIMITTTTPVVSNSWVDCMLMVPRTLTTATALVRLFTSSSERLASRSGQV